MLQNFSDSNQNDLELKDTVDEAKDQLFDQDPNEDEDFESCLFKKTKFY